MIGIVGFEKKQDCVIKVTLKNTGGLKIQINSKLKMLFEKLIKKAVEVAAHEMNVENAEIEVWDFGALDFVIKARVKTAIKRARGAK